MELATLQRLMASTWPGLEQGRLGEWELRAAGGFTGRANSALPLGDPGRDLVSALAEVTSWYQARWLAPRIQVPSTMDGSPGPADQLAELCDRGGWSAEPWTLVLVREPHPLSDTLGLALDWSPAPDREWLDLYRYRGWELAIAARRVITAAPAEYLKARLDGELVGIGRAALAGQLVVSTAIEVVGAWRRRGFGAVITEALAARGAARGAMLSALQVFAHNEGALALYRLLGYSDHHRYRYRSLPTTRP